MVRRDPRCLGVDRTRWRLTDLGTVIDWLADHSPSGVWRVLDRLGIGYTRARDHVHSPDPAYAAKQAAIMASRTASRTGDGHMVTLFLDELTVHRQPPRASAYAARGQDQPRAERSYRQDATARIVATLDPHDGRVVSRRRREITVATLVGFYQDLVAAYPDAQQIDLVLDNWPVHGHPDLLVALQPQTSAFALPQPPNWPTDPSPAAVRKWGHLQLPIQLVPLPTYASWLNPIEKLWRWLKQEVVHLHPWADDLPALYAAADAFLARFTAGSQAGQDLLRYVGLGCHD